MSEIKVKPTGYYILVKMEEIKKEIQDGALKGFVTTSSVEQEREQSAHDIGVIVDIGPAAYSGFQGVPMEDPRGNPYTAAQRAAYWGCKVGDKVEMNRYDGKNIHHPDYEDHKLIQDAHIIAVLED